MTSILVNMIKSYLKYQELSSSSINKYLELKNKIENFFKNKWGVFSKVEVK